MMGTDPNRFIVAATVAMLVLALGLTWLATASGGLSVLPEPLAWLVRAGLPVSGLAIAYAAHLQGERRHWISPLFLLGICVPIFYSLFTAAYADFAFSSNRSAFFDEVIWITGETVRANVYAGSDAEALVLQFAAFCLTLFGFLVLIARDRMTPTGGEDRPQTTAAFVAGAIGLVAVAAAPLLRNAGLQGATVPVLSAATFGAVLLVLCLPGLAGWRRIVGLALLGAIVAGSVGMVWTKMGALLAVSVFLIWFALFGAPKGKRLVAGLSGVGLVVVLVIGVLATFRYEWVRNDFTKIPGITAASLVAGKLGVRQAVTGYCLTAVMRQSDGVSEKDDHPAYFLAALVPRAVWPNKPSISSQGLKYARHYCGLIINESQPMSASVTVLGEPLDRAGWGGLILAQGVLLGLLAGITALLRRGRVFVFAAAATLIPWSLDFDQHFSLYLANMVKAGLFAVPLATACWLIDRWRRPG